MKNFIQSMMIVMIMLVMFIVLMFTIGCSTENPLCSDNYCVSGEIFLRSQLLEGEEFSEIDVAESQLLAAFANTTPQTPVQTLPDAVDTDVSLMDIINDVANGGEKYLNQTVTITATVVFKSDDGTGITLYKNANIVQAVEERANLSVISLDDPIPLAKYSVGNTYTFTVLIRTILPPTENRAFYSIGAVLAE